MADRKERNFMKKKSSKRKGMAWIRLYEGIISCDYWSTGNTFDYEYFV